MCTRNHLAIVEDKRKAVRTKARSNSNNRRREIPARRVEIVSLWERERERKWLHLDWLSEHYMYCSVQSSSQRTAFFRQVNLTGVVASLSHFRIYTEFLSKAFAYSLGLTAIVINAWPAFERWVPSSSTKSASCSCRCYSWWLPRRLHKV